MNNIIIASIIVASIIIRARYDSFAKRVISLRDVNVNNSEFEYDLVADKNNENNNDLFIIIEEKINKEKKDYYILFINSPRIKDNTLS